MKRTVFKISISLPPELNTFIEEVMAAEGHGNRSLVIQRALRLLRHSRYLERDQMKRSRQASRAAERSAQQAGYLAEEAPFIDPDLVFAAAISGIGSPNGVAGEGRASKAVRGQRRTSNAELRTSKGSGSAPCQDGETALGPDGIGATDLENALSADTATSSLDAGLHMDTQIEHPRESALAGSGDSHASRSHSCGMLPGGNRTRRSGAGRMGGAAAEPNPESPIENPPGASRIENSPQLS